MAQQYTIEKVSTQVPPKDWNTKKGDTYTKYRVMINGDPVDVSVPKEHSELKAGDVVSGDIKDSEYGKNMVVWKQQGGGGSRGSYSKQPTDPYTMYLSYAKDVASAMIAKGGYNKTIFLEVLKDIKEGGDLLYQGHETGTVQDTTPKAEAKEPPKQPDEVAEFGDEPINLDDIPF